MRIEDPDIASEMQPRRAEIQKCRAIRMSRQRWEFRKSPGRVGFPKNIIRAVPQFHMPFTMVIIPNSPIAKKDIYDMAHCAGKISVLPVD